MASTKQIAANRRNARKSTGPRTDAGKARSAMNAVTHGLTSRAAVLPDENAAEYAAFAAGVLAELAPVGVLETACAVRVADGMWRLLRIGRLEAASFALCMEQESQRTALARSVRSAAGLAESTDDHASGAAFLRMSADGVLTNLSRYEAAIQRGVERSLAMLRDAQERRMAEELEEPETSVSPTLQDEADSPASHAGQGLTRNEHAGASTEADGAVDAESPRPARSAIRNAARHEAVAGAPNTAAPRNKAKKRGAFGGQWLRGVSPAASGEGTRA